MELGMESKREGEGPPLLLMTHSDEDDMKRHKKQSLCDVSNNVCHTTSVPILCGKQILGFSHGWFVLWDTQTESCWLWNPSTRKQTRLPELKVAAPGAGGGEYYNRAILSKPPTEPGCHILCTARHELAFCQVGDEEFVLKSLPGNSARDGELMALYAVEFSFNNANIYAWVGYKDKDYDIRHRLVSIHFTDKTVEWRVVGLRERWHLPKPMSIRPWSSNVVTEYLIKSPCKGELLLVCRMTPYSTASSFDFRVFLMDTERRKCEETEDIGDRTIFISNLAQSFCSSSSCSTGINPNCIYYTTGRIVYIYHLRNRGITWFIPCPHARRSFKTTSCCWIQPAGFPITDYQSSNVDDD